MRNLGKFADLADEKQKSLLAAARCIPLFANLEEQGLVCLQQAELIEADAGDRVLEKGEKNHSFWVLLNGGLTAEYIEPDGTRRVLATHHGCETFGEVPLLAGLSSGSVECTMVEPSRLLRLHDESFWQMMTACPSVRKGILANMAARQQGLQKLVLQREKLAALGMMSAGLMHELNNPGSAAKRAAIHLRESLTTLQEKNLRGCRMGLRDEEMQCIAGLQDSILRSHKMEAVDPLDLADAEEALAQWLEEAGVEDSWKLAPPLVEMGLTAKRLECLRVRLRPDALTDTLQWMEALATSVQDLETIEESITRISELAMAVKHYSHSEKVCCHEIDIHKSLQSALMILGHKIRQKEIQVSKNFSAEVPMMQMAGSGLHQVWMNLLDNAIDAAPQKGHIAVRTWVDGPDTCVSVCDDGEGINPEYRSQIFKQFFTTKAAGVGTGLGLSIAHKIVTVHFGGTIGFESEPGKTEFIVRLPQQPPEAAKKTL